MAPPMAMPRIMGKVSAKVSPPDMLRACSRPTAPAEDWISAVKTMPAGSPSSGFAKRSSRA